MTKKSILNLLGILINKLKDLDDEDEVELDEEVLAALEDFEIDAD